MSSRTMNVEYSRLLTKFSPKVIRTEKTNEEYSEALYELDQRDATLTRAEKELAGLLTVLIEDLSPSGIRCRVRSLWRFCDS